MNKDEVKKLMNYIAMNYNTFKVTKENYEYWCNELSQYDYDDIRNRLKEMMSDEKYAYQPPFLEALTRGLTKKDNKVNLDEITYYCQFCKRPFTDKSELDIHEDRCSAIRYIRRQYQRFGWYKLSGTQIKEMYNMPEDEFDEKYKIILRKVQSLTTDEMEKRRIEYIFNPPNQEEAKDFLDKDLKSS